MTLKMVDTSFKSTKIIISDTFFKAIITTVKKKNCDFGHMTTKWIKGLKMLQQFINSFI